MARELEPLSVFVLTHKTSLEIPGGLGLTANSRNNTIRLAFP